jgi:recombination protein RecA
VKKVGNFYSFDETRLGQGRENAKSYLRQHKDMAQDIEGKIRVIAFTSETSLRADAQLAE